MGYFCGHRNWFDFAERNGITRTCTVCNKEFTPRSPSQKKHSYQDWIEDNEDCYLHSVLDNLSSTKYLKHVGLTKAEYIKQNGIELYNMVVLQLPSKTIQ